ADPHHPRQGRRSGCPTDHGRAQRRCRTRGPREPQAGHPLMRTAGLAGFVKKRRHRTTVPEPAGQVVPGLLGRDFTAEAPNRRYVGDITYLPLSGTGGGGNLYLATVIDCDSRRLVGWAIADHMRTDLAADALKAAAATRGSPAGAIFHSDHGWVYTSKAYADLCARLGVTQSMGA